MCYPICGMVHKPFPSFLFSKLYICFLFTILLLFVYLIFLPTGCSGLGKARDCAMLSKVYGFFRALIGNTGYIGVSASVSLPEVLVQKQYTEYI